MSAKEAVCEQLELIRSSLLPAEKLILSSDETPTTLLTFEIISKESTYSIHVVEQEHSYEDANTLRRFRFQIRSTEMNRDEALGWETWVEEVVRDHGEEAEQGGYPLSTLITEHFLPLLQSLATREEPKVDAKPKGEADGSQRTSYRPGHILFSSHHLLAPSKRKNLVSLSSQLGLVGFGKVGYPGIIFAEGDVDDLEEFSREVKSWQWLALRLRVLEADEMSDTAAKQPRKGHWEELTKVGEAVDWLKKIGKEHLLLDVGIGSGGHKA